MLGLARGDLELIARGLHDRVHERYRAHLYPRSAELARGARALGALGATISGAGPTVLVWAARSAVGAVTGALEAQATGWARVLAVEFAAGGAEVS